MGDIVGDIVDIDDIHWFINMYIHVCVYIYLVILWKWNHISFVGSFGDGMGLRYVDDGMGLRYVDELCMDEMIAILLVVSYK